jgi:hypothetical protein
MSRRRLRMSDDMTKEIWAEISEGVDRDKVEMRREIEGLKSKVGEYQTRIELQAEDIGRLNGLLDRCHRALGESLYGPLNDDECSVTMLRRISKIYSEIQTERNK